MMIFIIQLNLNNKIMKKLIYLLAFLVVGVNYAQVQSSNTAKYYAHKDTLYAISPSATLDQFVLDLAATTPSDGASLIGVEDSGGNFTSNDLEGVLTELHTLGSSGLSTANQEKLDNRNKTRVISISANTTLTAANAETSDSPYEGFIRNVVNGNYTITLNNAEDLNVPFEIMGGATIDSTFIERLDNTYTLIIDGINGVFPAASDASGVYLEALESGIIERTGDKEYLIRTGGGWVASGAYSPNNLYVEASAVNNDNYAATIGTWGTFQINDFALTASLENDGIGQGSFNWQGSSPNSYTQFNFTFTGSASTSYQVRFKYEFLDGPEFSMLVTDAAVDDGRVIIDNTANPADDFSNNGVFTYNFTTDGSATPNIFRFYGGFENIAGGAQHIRITAFEIIQL